jgi:hypothetical protein
MWNPLDTVKDTISAIGTAVTAPIAAVITRKEERKQAHQTMMGQLKLNEQSDATTIEVTKVDLEKVMQGNIDKSWKDEFVTVCFVGIVPAVMVGGVLHGFGYPAFLVGVLMGINALAGIIALSPIMTTVVAAAVGVSTLKRLL